MSPIAIRQKLRHYLETADDKKLLAIYTLVEDDIEDHDAEYSDDFKKSLEKTYRDHKNGVTKSYSLEDIRAMEQDKIKLRRVK